MPERFGDILTMLMGALALGYVVYEIERRRRKLHDLWDVLDEEDALLTEKSKTWSRVASFSPTPRRWLDGRSGVLVRDSGCGGPFSAWPSQSARR
jgi:hypothetical protein